MKGQKQIFLVFLLLLIIFTKQYVTSWNDGSRIAAIESLVDYSSFAIDRSLFLETGDKYFYEGNFYSTKPPIFALLGSGVYFVINSWGFSFQSNYRATYYLLTILVIGGTSCLGGTYFYKILRRLQAPRLWADVLLFLVLTGTLILPYSTVFNNHTVSACLLIASFYYLLKTKDNYNYSILSGLLLSLAGSIDFAIFVFTPFWLFFFTSRKLRIRFLVSCLPVITIYLLLNLHLTGSLIPAVLNSSLYNYPGSEFKDAVTRSSAGFKWNNFLELARYAFRIILGNRGLFSYSPVLLLSIYVGIKNYFQKGFSYKKEYLFIFTSVLTYIIFCFFFTSNAGGCSYGIRYLMPTIFLLYLPLAHLSKDVTNSKIIRILFVITSFISILTAVVGLIHPYTNFYTDCNVDNTFITALRIIWVRGYPDPVLVNVDLSGLKLWYRLGLAIALPLIYYNFYLLWRKFLAFSQNKQN